ncbi:hypothetical protein [Pseudoalteromonas luteoviolacea]|uniref:DUF8213 domain-containing protein n=1 Tax=Pseudoalteromonas luteoviolacea DSM 6061 TaxID=1365250 RepID=A0A166UXB3_9GAMM|nr:hypothetical protein [Pseudoalteromonas luteoviolacea]KZN31479.1 hypothetical protein N475_23350 [Pseudoalteromonas luteoviolacea DSM 6061]MBE0388143.1 hypothetical protein [Pseudoalteromonas luteoviolacea DSM 6061]TQF72821.1 hypothetical protein FLM44_18050 [Pseudoalteromonas luteoviolacea]
MKKLAAYALALCTFGSHAVHANTDLSIQVEENTVSGHFQTSLNTSSLKSTVSGDNNVVKFSLSDDLNNHISSTIKFNGNTFNLKLDNTNNTVHISGFDINDNKLINSQKLKSSLTSIFRDSQNYADDVLKVQSKLDKESKIVLFKFFEFLSTYPVGMPIEQSIEQDFSAQGWTDLCPYMGRYKTAIWDVTYVGVKTKSYKVGGHGFCAARCGAGCPMFGDGQYTQDCLNHDACADVEGEQLGVCGDEWTSASDDFWFSPDCETPPSS